jgi:hypothetical protein
MKVNPKSAKVPVCRAHAACCWPPSGDQTQSGGSYPHEATA